MVVMVYTVGYSGMCLYYGCMYFQEENLNETETF